MGLQEIFVFAALVVFLILWRRGDFMERLIELLNNFRGGGPPTPMHPSPVNDGALLRRRVRKIENWYRVW
jgi:hypothetical protein